MHIYLNGDILPEKEAAISPLDHGYMYGLGLFETFPVYGRCPFLLDDHLKRLHDGLSELGIMLQWSREQIIENLNRLLAANGLENAYVRLNVSAGNGAVGLQTEPYRQPTRIIYMKPLDPTAGMPEKSAVFLKTKRNTPEGKSRLKSHHYMNNILAKQEIGGTPGIEGIFLTENGFLAEGIVSNLFWMKNGKLYTPAVETGILAGIMRKFVLALARQAGIPAAEGFYRKKELLESDEAFITNSIQGIVPLDKIGTTELPGKRGAAAMDLYKKYIQARTNLWSIYDLQSGGRSQ
ncbi:aminodeoxychorismate lyase [Bacillus marinisedimentorum]|uniref:aminodeoxychorismate lyase n=1 Tax=Bacillus marinisedimentorum TaxID=1821260 RepID=UPI0007DF433A|nr:aminodeoxychorismate lyase [Bacillus marinisedimentorum]